MSLSMLLAMVVAVLGGGAVGWLLARRAADQAGHAHALELASLRAELAMRAASVTRLDQHVDQLTQAEERLSAAFARAQSDFTRAETEARSLGEQLTQLRRAHELLEGKLEAAQRDHAEASTVLARTGADLETTTRQAERVPALEARLAELTEALVRREAEVEAQRSRGDQLEIEVAAVPQLREQVQGLSESLARRDAEAQAQAAVRAQLEGELVTLRPLRERVQTLAEDLSRVTAERDAEKRRTEERLAEAEKARETLKLEVHALGQQLLEDKGKAMVELNRQGIEGLLAPVRDSLRTFQDQFQRNAEETIRDRASFLQQVRGLQDAQSKLSADANALARALTGDSKAQGDWGEVVLEKLLESAGLQEGVHFDLQLNHVTDEGKNRRPDALVYLPGERAIVIDSKCSLTAFVESTKAIDEDERETDLTAHCASMRAHAKDLAKKDYTSVLKQRSPDFVLMFVPSEAAFQAALSRDPALVDDAYRGGKVVICSPSTVLATLQMVNHVWRTERQTSNAQRIAEEAGKMVDKLGGVVEAFAKVGTQLDLAQSALGDAKSRLSTGKGSLLALANKVTKLGARVKTEKLAAANRALGGEVDEEGPELESGVQGALLLEAGGEPSVA